MPAIIFHHLTQAECALAVASEVGRPVTLLTAPGAATYGGPVYLLAMVNAAKARHADVQVRAILDCGDDGALAQMAFGHGWRSVVLRGSREIRRKVTEIARHYEAEVLAQPPKAFDPGAELADITNQCRALYK